MADLDDLLRRTSRTFALAIPLLPRPTRDEVTIAYLLFRIADTFEDATRWTPASQVEALEAFRRAVAGEGEPGRLASAWLEAPPLDQPDYVELLGQAPAVLGALETLRPEAREAIRRHVGRTAAGMARYARRAAEEGGLHLRSLEELREYCYVVAGIVGEMLTDLFLLDGAPVAGAADALRARARHFGEGLQLVNVLKDAAGDAEEGRRYLPDSVSRGTVFALAREDLRRAEEYVEALRAAGAPRGLVAFTALPVLLAWEALAAVEARGPGAKVTRQEVAGILARMHAALDRGEPVVGSPSRAS